MSFNQIEACLQYIQLPELIEEFKDGEFDDEMVKNDIQRHANELKNIIPSEKLASFIDAFKNPETVKKKEMEIVQLIEFQSSFPYLRLKEETYESISKNSMGMEIGFVSMVGSPEAENTFFINYLKRFLKIRERNHVGDDWILTEYESKLVGFPWGKAASATAPGVWITSTPFIIQGNKPIAIYVTHTTFIAPIEKNRYLNERLAFLQLLTSSLTIYSFPEKYFSFQLPLAMNWTGDSKLSLGHLFFLVKSSQENITQNEKHLLEQHEDLKEHLNIFSSIEGLTISQFPGVIQKKNCEGSVKELMDSPNFIPELERTIMRILDESKLGVGLHGLAKQFFNEPISSSNYFELLEALIKDLNTPLKEEVDMNEKAFTTLIDSLIKNREKEVKDFYNSKMDAFIVEKKFVDEQKLSLIHEKFKQCALEFYEKKLGNLVGKNLNSKLNNIKTHFNGVHAIKLRLNVSAKNMYLQALEQSMLKEFREISAQFINLNDEEFENKTNQSSVDQIKEKLFIKIYESFNENLSQEDEENMKKKMQQIAENELGLIGKRQLEIRSKKESQKREEELRKAEEAEKLQKLKKEALEILDKCLEDSLNDFKTKISQIELSLDFDKEFDRIKDLAINSLTQPDLISVQIFNEKKIELSRQLNNLKSTLKKKFNEKKINNIKFIESEYARIMAVKMLIDGKEFYDENEIVQFNNAARKEIGGFLVKPNKQTIKDFKQCIDKKFLSIKEKNLKVKERVEKELKDKKIEAEKAELFKKEMEKIGQEIHSIVASLYSKIEGMILTHKIRSVVNLKSTLAIEINIIKEKLENFGQIYKNNEFQLEIEKAIIDLESYEDGEKASKLTDLLIKEKHLMGLEKEIENLVSEGIHSRIGVLFEKGEKFTNLNEEFEIKSQDVEDALMRDFVMVNENISSEADIQRMKNKMKEVFGLKLLTYVEQNQMNAAKNSPIIGIDFGTSFTSCAIYENGKCKTINFDDNEEMSPTIVAYIMPSQDAENQTPIAIYGKAAKNQDHLNPENTIYEPKRLLGRLFNDQQLQQDMKYWQTLIVKGENDRAMIKLSNGELVDPKDVAILILKKIRAEATKYCNFEVTFVVITIPIKASNEYKDVMHDAAYQAGFREINFMREPVAAAISYRMNMPEMRETSKNKIVVFDFGGGTLDLCIFQCDVNTLKVIETGGDQQFGGKNFDEAIFDYFIANSLAEGKNYLEHKHSSDPVKSKDAKNFERRLLNVIETGKKNVSTLRSIPITLGNIGVADNIDINLILTRNIFEKANEENFNKIKIKLERLFYSKKVSKSEISHVIMVGGMSNVPKVKEVVLDFFGGKDKIKLVDKEDKQLAVAYGAARHSAKLFGQKSLGESFSTYDKYNLEDIVPAAIGIGYASGEDRLLQIVVPRGSVIPFEVKIDCTTDSNEQTQVYVPIYEEKEEIDQIRILTTDVRLSPLGSFTLKTTGKEAGLDLIDVYLYYDANLIIRVEAVNQSNGLRKDLEIKSVFAIGKGARENLKKRIRLMEKEPESSQPKSKPKEKLTIQKLSNFNDSDSNKMFNEVLDNIFKN